MTRHRTYVYSRTDVVDGFQYQATCTCGWEGTATTNTTVADMGARRHDQENNEGDGEKE